MQFFTKYLPQGAFQHPIAVAHVHAQCVIDQGLVVAATRNLCAEPCKDVGINADGNALLAFKFPLQAGEMGHLFGALCFAEVSFGHVVGVGHVIHPW